MNKIEVAVLHESHECPAGMMMFLAKLTQRGHQIKSMEDLINLYNSSIDHHKTARAVAHLPHGTIKRFTPITIAIVGASRRFLAQARTHQVGITYVSGSLQYSDFSTDGRFVVPYPIIAKDAENNNKPGLHRIYTQLYLDSCEQSMKNYEILAKDIDNDTAGYVAPQGLRNVLIMQANHEAWMNFIRARACNRNTDETQYVTMRIWEELLKTADGEEMFYYAGPDCCFGACREGKGACGNPMRKYAELAEEQHCSIPSLIIKEKWPLLVEHTE